ncbi:MAG: type II toxin-antitoxin system HicB family antitoxin [Gemmatimonadota bacterium]|nr:type II toxin-antitoxin system HicB family antitoxin [Gemmatimonadota bacterium]
MTRRYLIVIEETTTGFSAYSPDLPGCVATGASDSEVKRAMREAIELHVTGLREEGQPVPKPESSSDYVEISS